MRRAIITASALTVAGWGLTAKGQALYVDDFYTTHPTFYRPPADGSGNGTLADTQWVAWNNNGSGNNNGGQSPFVNLCAEAQLSNWGWGTPSDPSFPNPVNSPTVAGGQPGAIFWSTLVNNMVMYTQNSNLVAASINTSSVRNISFYAQSDPVPQTENAAMYNTNGWNLHAIVEVGGSWYASANEQQVAEENAKGIWAYFTISTAATKWFPVILNDDASAANYSGPVYYQNGTTPIALPAGAIQGVGVGTGIGDFFFAPGGSSSDTPPHNPNLEITDFQLSHTPAAVVWGNGYAVANSLTPADGITWDVTNNLNWGTGTFPEVYASPYVDGDGTAANQGGAVIFNDSNNGKYAVTLNAVVHPGSITVSNSSGNYTFSGSGGITGSTGLTKTGSGSLMFATTNTYTGPTNINQGAVTLAATGSISNSLITVGNGATAASLGFSLGGSGISVRNLLGLNISSTGSVTVAQTTNHANRNVLDIGSGGFTNTGILDLSNNDLVIQGGASNLASIYTQLKTGFNAHNGYWNGSAGIISTAAANNTTRLTTLGYSTGGTMFDGLNSTTNDVLVKYTYYGDADLNGLLNGADYHQIDLGFGGHLTGWSNGDFNYDGVVDGSDYTLIDNTYNQITATGASPLGLTAGSVSLVAVPEPTTLSALGVGTIALLARRRRIRT